MPLPKSMRVGNVGIYPRRGPNERGQFYWLARDTGGDRDVRWRGWATAGEVVDEVAEVMRRDRAEEPGPEPPGSVAAMCWGWYRTQERRGDIDDGTTKRNYRRDIESVVRTIGPGRASALTQSVLEDYRDRRITRDDAATATVKQELKRLLSAWNWAVDRRQVPARRLRMPKIKDRPKRSQYTPTPRDVEAVREALTNNWARVAVDLIWAMGLRIGEAAGLTWGDVLAESIRIEGKSTDRNPSGIRYFPRNRRVNDAIAGAVPGEGADTLTGVKPNRITSQLAEKLGEACRSLGIPHWTAQNLRRAVEDRMANTGMTVTDFTDLLGHSEQIGLKHYRRSSNATRAKAAALDD